MGFRRYFLISLKHTTLEYGNYVCLQKSWICIHKYVGLLVKIFTVFIITNHVSIHLAYQVVVFFNHFFDYLKNWCHYLLHFFTGVVLLNFFLFNCLHISVHFFVLFWCRKIKPIEDQTFVPDTWIHVYWKL